MDRLDAPDYERVASVLVDIALRINAKEREE